MSGYPHLHLGTGKSSSGDESVGPRGGARGLRLFDPLAIYHETGEKLRELPPLPAGAVFIPYASTDGKVTPAGTRVVWPVACQPK